ncbi:MAG: ribosome small subunit-dependent GTPase A [Oscillospiraceae bacterium]|jgi:ribosome biogenesis GTPase|nr:ribosome small subunit-dependent GTPase A [Oscillospiraceae bacterium]
MLVEGRIHQSLSGFYAVHCGETIYTCRACGRFRKENITPRTGDFVRAEVLPDGTGTVSDILPRKNTLVRPPLSNIDQLFFVSSTVEPRPNLYLLDMLIAEAERLAIEPILVFTKADLADASPYCDIYRRAGFQTFRTAVDGNDFVPRLRALLANKTSAFCGNTGVGKSTLLNRLDPALALQTGAISRKLGRGRHTTRVVTLHAVAGGLVADTPGFSLLMPVEHTSLEADALPQFFREFAPFLDDCQFVSCTHTTEKGCAVLAGVAQGVIPQTRYQNYCALWESLKDVRAWNSKRK